MDASRFHDTLFCDAKKVVPARTHDTLGTLLLFLLLCFFHVHRLAEHCLVVVVVVAAIMVVVVVTLRGNVSSNKI